MNNEETSFIQDLLKSIHISLTELQKVEPNGRAYGDYLSRLEYLAQDLNRELNQAKRWASFKD
jgi:hypothetical protein